MNRDLGDWVWGALDADYRVTRSFGLDVEYAFLSKGRDSYKSDARDLAMLEKDTEQEVHQTRLGMSYNFEGGARRGVEKKWVASLGYTYPWIGKNSSDASRAALEIMTYF